MSITTIEKPKIWLSSPHMGDMEQQFVDEAFATNWIAPLGPNVNGFEDAISSYLGNSSNVAALSSGTAAIHLGLQLLGVGKNDDVLCQSFTFSASANPICYLGANPVFIDSETDTWNMCPILLEQAITEGIAKNKKPKAIVAVHLYGMPYKVKALHAISEKYDVPILEDSAEALGSRFEDRNCGTFGTIGVLSFNGNKIITTSGGGALVAKNKEIKDRAVHLATQARDDAPHYQHSAIGYNYRMSNVLAGIGRGQMMVLDDRVNARRFNHEYYRKRLEAKEEITFLEEGEGYFSNRWLTCVLTPSFEIREKIRMGLLAENIESRPLWKPMHLQPVFKDSKHFVNGVSETLFDKGLCLPSGSNLTEADLSRITTAIENILK